MSEIPRACKVKANDFEFTIDPSAVLRADIVQKSPADFNAILNHRSVNARVLESDVTGTRLKVEVEGETFDIEIRDHLHQILDQMGFSTVSSKHIKHIKAPMPGLVISIAVTEGQEVKEGERILVLEAMKMENSILIHADGKIKRVAVKAGQAVDKGQVLVELD